MPTHKKSPKELSIEGKKKHLETGKHIGKFVGKTVISTYKTIDALDKAIGQAIGGKSRKVTDALKNNIIKILISAGVLFGGSYTAYNAFTKHNDKDEQEEIVNDDTHIATLKDLFQKTEIDNLSGGGKDYQKKWEKNYAGNNEERDRMHNGESHRKRMIQGFVRMIESGDLAMVIKKLKDKHVPLDMVFLAITESYWTADANSGVAGGYRQFTKASAKAFGAIDKQGNDFRNDPEISTDAAIEHLEANYGIVTNRCKSTEYKHRGKVSEDDKWIFAMYMYNGSPKLVKKGFLKCKGNANEYPVVQDNSENRNYVPRILAIKNVLKTFFESYEYDIKKIKNSYNIISKQYTKTNADKMFESYTETTSLDSASKVQMLNKIKDTYHKELKDGQITQKYYEGVIQVIEEELDKVNNPDEDQQELKSSVKEPEQTPGIFVFLNKSVDKKYKVYSYIIKEGGNVGGVKNQFYKQMKYDGILLVTNIKGDKYAVSTNFDAGTEVFVKEPTK